MAGLQGQVVGLPGLRTALSAVHRIVFYQGQLTADYAGGKIINGDQSRDTGNTGDLGVLRAGTLMGKITASGKYAPAFVGVLSAAYTSGGTELTVSAAVATELARLLGQAGTAEMVAIGPPTANGTVATTDITHSAINTTTGAITVSSLGVDKVAGTLIAVKDGRQTPVSVIPDGFGVNVLNENDTGVDVNFSPFPVAGWITSEQLLPVWPSDTSIQAYITDAMKNVGVYVFKHSFDT